MNEDGAKDENKDDKDDEDGEKKIQKVTVKWKAVTMKFCARALYCETVTVCRFIAWQTWQVLYNWLMQKAYRRASTQT